MLPISKRFQVYKERIDTDERGFLADVDRWKALLPEDTVIGHHVGQFRTFYDHAIRCLMVAYDQKSSLKAKDKREAFRSLVIASLITQWTVLRQVAQQRAPGSPYASRLADLDKRAASQYLRLVQAMPAGAQEKVLTSVPGVEALAAGDAPQQSTTQFSPPMVYLGRLAELTIFNPRAPGVLSVPFGAMEDDGISPQAISHEMSHAVYNRLPGFLTELRFEVLKALASSPRTGLQKVVQGLILDWLGEMAADMGGTALSGVDFARSALRITVSPDETVGVTDGEHPVSLIRPYVHLSVLRHVFVNDAVQDLESEIEDIVGTYIDRRFESGGLAAVIPLRMVKEEMDTVVEQMLNSKPSVLEGKSLGQVLKRCAESELDVRIVPPASGGPGTAGTIDILLPKWGEVTPEECANFVLRLSGSQRPLHATPVAFRYWICCSIDWPICC